MTETKVEEKKEEPVAEVIEAAPKEETKEEKKVTKPKESTTNDDDASPVDDDSTLVPIEEYLKAGIHIGSQYKTGDMRRYIYKTRQDGLHVLDIKTINDRLAIASDFLSKYEPSKILVVAGRVYARKPARKFAENVGAMLSVKRFVPGTLTNPNNPNFVEPEVLIVSDPGIDKQAIKEAERVKIPVVAMCDTNNVLKNIDLVIPLNNKGKKALALSYWLLAREIQLKHGIIKSVKEWTPTVEDFETTSTVSKSSSGKQTSRPSSGGRGRRGGGKRR